MTLSIADRPAIAHVLTDPGSASADERDQVAARLERRSKTLYQQADAMEAKRNPALINTIAHMRERAMELANQAESLRQYQEG